MGRIIATEFVSLDGVVEAPGGDEDFEYAGWSFEIDRGEEGNKVKLDGATRRSSAVISRRKSAACPSGTTDPSSFTAAPPWCRDSSSMISWTSSGSWSIR